MNKTALYHRHSLIRRLTSIIRSMIAGLCVPIHTSNEFERCRSFFRPRSERERVGRREEEKERLVTRNHLTAKKKKKTKGNSINRSICIDALSRK
jgi:hypothetical protein